MENKTLQEVYKNASDEVKEILKNRFSNDELGIEPIENQIRNEILELIRKNIKNIRFLLKNDFCSDLPTDRFEILNENRKWLFDIDYNEKTKHFWFSYNEVFLVFESKYDINDVDFYMIMNTVLNEDLKLNGVTPRLFFFC